MTPHCCSPLIRGSLAMATASFLLLPLTHMHWDQAWHLHNLAILFLCLEGFHHSVPLSLVRIPQNLWVVRLALDQL